MVIVRGSGKQASKMKEREPDTTSSSLAPKVARNAGAHVQSGVLFPPVAPLEQEYHNGRPSWLWSFQFNTYVETWELGVPGERGPSGEIVDTSGWSREQMAQAGVWLSPPQKGEAESQASSSRDIGLHQLQDQQTTQGAAGAAQMKEEILEDETGAQAGTPEKLKIVAASQQKG